MKVETMNTTEEILKRIDLVGAKLGMIGNETFSAYQKAAFIEGIGDIIFALFLLGSSFAFGLLVRKNIRDKEDGLIIVFSILTAFFCFLFVACCGSILQEMINPQYWAIKHLLQDFSR